MHAIALSLLMLIQ